MSYEYMMYGGIIGTAFFFSLSLILFFKLNIAKAIGDITGASMRNGIQKIQNNAKRTISQKNSQYKKNDKIIVKFAGNTLSLKDNQRNVPSDTAILTEHDEVEETTLLYEDDDLGTVILVENERKEKSHSDSNNEFEYITDVVVFHTDESIGHK